MVLQFVDPSIGGRLVQRVITRRLPVVSSLSDYLRGVNAEVAAAVLAKKAVLDARRQGTIWSPAKAEELRSVVATRRDELGGAAPGVAKGLCVVLRCSCGAGQEGGLGCS